MMARAQTLLARSRSSGTIEEVPLASYVGENVLFWNTSDGLGGIAVWGRPPRREIEQFVTLAESILDGGALAPRTIFADLQELEAVDTDSFELVRDHIQRVGPRLAELGVREAVLRPRGLVGAVVAGFYATSPWLSSHRVFETAADAEVWLERPESSRAPRAGRSAPRHATARSVSALHPALAPRTRAGDDDRGRRAEAGHVDALAAAPPPHGLLELPRRATRCTLATRTRVAR